MKILYIVSTLKRSGPNYQFLNMLSKLPAEPVVKVLTLSPEPEDSLWSLFEELQVDVQSLSFSRIGGIFRNKSILQTEVNQFQPDIIHSQGIRADSLIAGLNTSAKKISTLHNFPQLDYPMTYGAFVGKLMCKYHVHKFKKFDRVVGVSDAVRDNLIERFQVENVSTVLNSVDTKIFHTVDDSHKRALRVELELPIEATVWVCTGHLSSRKNPLELITAWKDVFSDSPDQYLLFLGDGPLREACESEVSCLDNVRLVGRTPRVSDYLNAADVYVSPSTAEGMPGAVLEGMACGLPVILSDINPHKEIISLNSEVGMAYKMGSSSNLADVLQQFAIMDRSHMVKAVKCAIEEYLSASAMSAQYQALYKELLGGAL